MQKNVDIAIEDLKQNIVSEFEKSGLPISVVYYVMKTIFQDLEADYSRYIDQERFKQLQQAAAEAEAQGDPEQAPAPVEQNQVETD